MMNENQSAILVGIMMILVIMIGGLALYNNKAPLTIVSPGDTCDNYARTCPSGYECKLNTYGSAMECIATNGGVTPPPSSVFDYECENDFSNNRGIIYVYNGGSQIKTIACDVDSFCKYNSMSTSAVFTNTEVKERMCTTTIEENLKCSDSDNGKNYYTFGTVTGETTTHGFAYGDSCVNNNTLTEFFCDGLIPKSVTFNRAGYSCVDGKLIESSSPPDSCNNVTCDNTIMTCINGQTASCVNTCTAGTCSKCTPVCRDVKPDCKAYQDIENNVCIFSIQNFLSTQGIKEFWNDNQMFSASIVVIVILSIIALYLLYTRIIK